MAYGSGLSLKDFIIPILMALVTIFSVACLWVFYAASDRRRKALRIWAEERGLAFYDGEDRSMHERFGHLECLDRTLNQYACHVMQGLWGGLAITAFDYHYLIGFRYIQRVRALSAMVAASPVVLKPLLIRREGALDRLGKAIGINGIDFESAEFSRTHHVTSTDPKWAYDVIHPRMMAFLMEGQDYNIEFAPGHVIVWREELFTTEDFDDAVDFVRGILDLLPEYLVNQQTGRG